MFGEKDRRIEELRDMVERLQSEVIKYRWKFIDAIEKKHNALIEKDRADEQLEEEKRSHYETQTQLDMNLAALADTHDALKYMQEHSEGTHEALDKTMEELRQLKSSIETKANRFRTKEGLHICEKCGVVYEPVRVSKSGANTLDEFFEKMAAPIGGAEPPRTWSDLLLKQVNSLRFCPSCQEEAQGFMDSLRWLIENDGHEAACAFNRAVYEAHQAEKEGQGKDA